MKTFVTLCCILIFLLPCKGQMDGVQNNTNWGITFSLPWVNYYSYIDYYKNASARTFGFFGLGLSGYYKTPKQKTSVNISITEDLTSPVRINKLYGSEIKTNIGSTYFEIIQHRTMYENINVVYGFNFVNLHHGEWREMCGAVLQDGKIFSGTIADNIAIGKDKNYEQIIEAAKIACIDEFITTLPLGYMTEIGSEGGNLSTGQKQRILLARAIYKKPSFVHYQLYKKQYYWFVVMIRVAFECY